MLERWIKPFTLELSTVSEGIAALIIAFALVEALWGLARDALAHLHRNPAVAHSSKEDLRLRFGRWLALSLEFLLAADILRTAVAPSWSEIGQLAAVATIRTALNFFLQREIEHAAHHRERPATGAASPR